MGSMVRTCRLARALSEELSRRSYGVLDCRTTIAVKSVAGGVVVGEHGLGWPTQDRSPTRIHDRCVAEP